MKFKLQWKFDRGRNLCDQGVFVPTFEESDGTFVLGWFFL